MFNTLNHVKRILPARLRTEFNTKFVWTKLSPLQSLNTQFESWKASKRVEMAYNGQTIHMERMLNDLFDPTERRIAIIHDITDQTYRYFASEGQSPTFLKFHNEEPEDPTFILYYFEMDSVIIDGFVIAVPAELASRENEIKGQVLRYKLACVKYELDYID